MKRARNSVGKWRNFVVDSTEEDLGAFGSVFGASLLSFSVAGSLDDCVPLVCGWTGGRAIALGRCFFFEGNVEFSTPSIFRNVLFR